ncbi:LysM peptidoglycan-binding domain-containing protein [Sanguibacter sp. HDW7]|uniref:LysM peptidoglycan-binding domain-containing protein n=1 Tax=Sanguibacter sp. HDW7 TaxID=2714931 RepID=UPI00140D1905|nr:LysM peptidoglycan-binding domain-containing protein [Sanguibacter sp. HDW7]QIK83294.1 LysM peptidoglycan-binding domain-containing protein [Sanguibacter sp. HDW7]
MSTMSLAASPRIARAAAPAPELAPLRITRRGRIVLGLLVSAVLGSGALVFANGATADAPAGAQAVTVRTVGAGESLWAIASSVTAPGADVRDALQEIARLNGLTGSSLAAGQQLVVPVVDAD